MKFIRVMIWLIIMSHFHEGLGMIRRCNTQLMRDGYICRVIGMLVAAQNQPCQDGARLELDEKQSRLQRCHVPFDRHTAAKILRARREQASMARSKK